MFDSLDDEIKKDDQATSTRDRCLRYCVVLALSVILFGGLYLGVRFLE